MRHVAQLVEHHHPASGDVARKTLAELQRDQAALIQRARAYFFDKLPANPKHKYLEVPGGHLETPRLASEEIVKWIKTVVAL